MALSARQDRNRENRLFTQNISATSSVLVLNTHYLYSLNNSTLVDLNGNWLYCPAFTIADDVEVDLSCGVRYQDQLYVYGGRKNKRQIAKITNKSLTKVGSLPFNFRLGGCSSTTNEIFLCFDLYGDGKTCYKTTNPIAHFEKTRKSKHKHQWIKLASSECKFFIQTLILIYFSRDACLWWLVS